MNNAISPWISLLWHPGSGVLILLLVLAAFIDLRTWRIPNWLTAAGMAWGLVWSMASAPTVTGGALASLAGLGLGLAFFLPMWLIRVMGAGDVKLMAMVGAFLGPVETVKAALVVFIVGGLVVLFYAFAHSALRRLARNMRDIAASMVVPGMPMWRPELAGSSIGKLPYGVSISLGTIAFLSLRQLGYA